VIEMHRTFIFTLLTLGTLTACMSGRLSINDAWARPALAGNNGAVYFVIDNTSAPADVLLSASSDVAQAAEIHTSEIQNDVMKMLWQEKITIHFNTKVELKPGGMHIMLVNLKRDLKIGEMITLTLKFQNAGNVNVPARVEER